MKLLLCHSLVRLVRYSAMCKVLHKFLLVILLTFFAYSVHSQQSADSNKGSKDYYHDYFPIGVAVSPQSLKTDEAQLILQQFNSVTPENAMKMGPVHPKEDEYY